MCLMSLKKILLLPPSQTESKYGKVENGNRLFTNRDKKEESGKTDEEKVKEKEEKKMKEKKKEKKWVEKSEAKPIKQTS